MRSIRLPLEIALAMSVLMIAIALNKGNSSYVLLTSICSTIIFAISLTLYDIAASYNQNKKNAYFWVEVIKLKEKDFDSARQKVISKHPAGVAISLIDCHDFDACLTAKFLQQNDNAFCLIVSLFHTTTWNKILEEENRLIVNFLLKMRLVKPFNPEL